MQFSADRAIAAALLAAASGIALGAVLAASPALAAPLAADSRIDSVTVYPDAAQVTRIAEVETPAGATTLIITGLPMSLDPDSLRVEGTGGAPIQIASVETRVAPVEQPQQDNSLTERLRKLAAERDVTRGRMAAIDTKKAMIERYGQASPEKIGEKSAPLDVAKWSSAWDAVGEGLAQIAEESQTLRQKLAQIEQEIRALQASNRPGARRIEPTRIVTIEIEAQTATKSRFSLAYRVTGAGWNPIYDAQLVSKDKEKPVLHLVRRASVSQRTGENWSNVALSVSTVRARRGTQAPEVLTQRLRIFSPPPPIAVSRPMSVPAPAPAARFDGARAGRSIATAAAEPAREEKANETEATLEAGAYEAQFRIPGRIDLASDGSARALRIGSQEIDPSLILKTAPALDPTAYLEVSFINKDEAPILPGQVNIQRDGMFVGRGFFKLVAPGDEAKLGFGADERVKVTRAPVSRREATPGWLGANRTERQDFRTSVKNLHPFAIKISVIDRLPVSEDASIVVEPLSTNTAPTEKTIDQRRGVLGWNFDLAPNAEKQIRLGWQVRWPKDKRMTTDVVAE